MADPVRSTDPTSSSSAPPPAAAGFLLRAFWMMLGNGLLVLLAVVILQRPVWTPSLFDVAFWATVAALLTARTADVVWFSGLTADGRHATRVHLLRYAAGLVATAAAGWLAVQALEI
jgi:hypothetical protein